MKSKKSCLNCDNNRFVICDAKPVKCLKCNKDGKYKLKETAICLGCGRDTHKEDCDCPAGIGWCFIRQD